MPILDTPLRQQLWAALRLRRPRCCQGKIFSGRITMNARCPICGLEFEREPGYFLGAMYVSYFLSIPVIGLVMLVGYLLFPWIPLEWLALLAGAALIPLAPLLFRYSRVLWIHFDRWSSPGM